MNLIEKRNLFFHFINSNALKLIEKETKNKPK